MNNDAPERGMQTMPDVRHDLPGWLEDAWMQRYLDRELSVGEADWFEAYCLDREHLLARIEADLALRDALAREAAAPARAEPVKPQPRARRAPLPLAAAAAAMMVGVLLGGAGTAWLGRADVAPPAVSGDVTRLFFDSLRGETDAARIDHARSDSAFVIYDVAVPPDAVEVTLHVSGEADRELQPDGDGIATALIARSLAREREISLSYRRGGERVERVLALPAAANPTTESGSRP